MLTLRMRVLTPLGGAVSGESLRAETVLTNTGRDPEQIASAAGLSPFEYVLTGLTPEAPNATVSALLQYRRSLLGPGPNPPSLPPQALAPGALASREEDLAFMNGSAFPPGRYQVVANYNAHGTQLTSNTVPVTIGRPVVEGYATVTETLDSVVAGAMAVRTRMGRVDLLQRESQRGNPQFGVFIRRPLAERDHNIDGLAVAVNMGAAAYRRWVAWLSEGQIGASAGPGPDSIVTSVAVTTHLTSARLLSPGYQFPDRSAQFLVVGRRAEATVLQCYHFAAGQASMLWETPIAATALETLRARRRADERIDLLWTEPHGQGSRILMSRITWDGIPEAAPAQELVETPRPIVAWEAAITAAGPQGSVFALVAPDANRQLTSLRVALGGQQGEPASELIPAPPAAVTSWTILPAAKGAPSIAAWDADSIWFAAGQHGGAWTRVVEGEGVSHVELFAVDQYAIWLQWLGDKSGVSRRVVLAQ